MCHQVPEGRFAVEAVLAATGFSSLLLDSKPLSELVDDSLASPSQIDLAWIARLNFHPR